MADVKRMMFRAKGPKGLVEMYAFVNDRTGHDSHYMVGVNGTWVFISEDMQATKHYFDKLVWPVTKETKIVQADPAEISRAEIVALQQQPCFGMFA